MIVAYLVYTLLPLVMFLLLKVSASCRNKNEQYFLSISAVLLFSIILGLRYNVGVDYMAYMKMYVENIAYYREGIEYGYIFLCNILKVFDAHYSILFILLSFLQIYPIVKGMGNDKKALPTIILMLFATSVIFSMLNIIRQMIAFSMIFYSLRFIVSKSFKKYAIGIIIASLFHKSAIIFLPLYFVLNRININNRFIQFIALLFSFSLGAILQNYLWDILPQFYSIIYGNKLTDFQVEYYKTFNWDGGGKGLASYMWLIFDSIVILNYHRLRKYSIKRNIIFDVLYNLYFVGIVFSNIIGGSYLSRIIVYFESYRVFIYSYLSLYLINELKKQNRLDTTVYLLVLWGGLILFYYVAISKGAGLCSPYQFVF